MTDGIRTGDWLKAVLDANETRNDAEDCSYGKPHRIRTALADESS
jgi:hypothetical protein